jgi:hypothetical protein
MHSPRLSPTSFLKLLLLPVIGMFLGCGHRAAVAPVKGKVLLDGRPLTTGVVNTLPSAGRGAHGEIQSDGSFQLHTFANNDGALIGDHKVAVAAYDPSAGRTPESPDGKLLVPSRYTNPETSKLKINVQPSGNDNVVLELTTKDQK